jgi:hypothetical protein
MTTQDVIFRKLEDAGIAMGLSTVYASLALLMATVIVLPVSYFMNMFAYRTLPLRLVIGIYMLVLSIPVFFFMMLGSVPRLFGYTLIPIVTYFSLFGEADEAEKKTLFAKYFPETCNSMTDTLASMLAEARQLAADPTYKDKLPDLEARIREYQDKCATDGCS